MAGAGALPAINCCTSGCVAALARCATKEFAVCVRGSAAVVHAAVRAAYGSEAVDQAAGDDRGAGAHPPQPVRNLARVPLQGKGVRVEQDDVAA